MRLGRAGYCASYLSHLGEKVVNAVYRQVEGGEPAGEEASPPPMIILIINVLLLNFSQEKAVIPSN
jgi:hypothetical protein